MKIKNLAQMKSALKKGTVFEVLEHRRHPEWKGQMRVVNIVQCNCVYVQLLDQPEHLFSKFNGGRGIRMDFSPASHYAFGEIITWYGRPASDQQRHLIMTFQIREDGCPSTTV